MEVKGGVLVQARILSYFLERGRKRGVGGECRMITM